MIIIEEPLLIDNEDNVRISVTIKTDDKEEQLWYQIHSKYKEFLTIERSDAFLIALLFRALRDGEDIRVIGQMSKRLFYTCNTYLIPILSEVYDYKTIRVVCDHLVSEPLKTKGEVGTGLSCGIDSFSTIVDHLEDNSPEGYQVSLFTFFNVESNGDFGGDYSRKLFSERAEVAKKFADKVNKEFIMVDSNLSEILQLPFQSTHTLRSISVVLLLQKLFGVYYYSSTVHLRDFRLDKKDIAYSDVFNLSMLSTETVDLFSTCATKTRIEKTQMVANYEPSHEHLNVCVSGKDNCGKCFKCLRTLLTLELLGEINKFSNVFNLKEYQSNRDDYISYIIANKDIDPFAFEIYEEMGKKNYKIPVYSLLRGMAMKTKMKLVKLK